ncbi:MAG: tetratricopeptide repeat protein [Bacteroidetes bacterium]|nr:tetratricopeptide repeat protein [Bacteroidota bacterium]
MKNILFLALCLITVLPCNLSGQPPFDDEVTALVKQGIVLHDAGEYDKAMILYRKALEIDEDSEVAMYEMGFTRFIMGDFKKAEKWMKQVIKLDGAFANQAWQILGSAQDDRGKSKKAIRTFSKGIEAFPDDHLLYYNLALTLSRQDEWEDAILALENALDILPNHTSSLSLMAIAQEMEGERIKALMSAYLYLFFDPQANRAEEMVNLCKRLIIPNLEKDGAGDFNITLSSPSDSEFASQEMLIGLKAISLVNENEGDISVPKLFAEINQSLFSNLGENLGGKEGLWWEWFATVLAEIEDAGHAEVFSYYIFQAHGGDVERWLQFNQNKLKAFFDWIDNQ